MGIIICEYDNVQRKQIENIILKEIKDSNIDSNISLSTSDSKKVINYVRFTNDDCFIYFLDVELDNNINGIELANIIRKYDLTGYIVFVTYHLELILLTFKYKIQAMDYIVKSNSENLVYRIRECLIIAYNNFKKINQSKKKYISLNTKNKIINFQLDEILFFETDKNHRIKLHSFNTIFNFYSSLKKIQILLPTYFYKCHRAYIVNSKNIKCIDKSNLVIYMINGDKCYISKRYIKLLRDSY